MEGKIPPTDQWTRVPKKRKEEKLFPKRHYWCGFDHRGKEKWYIELSNGRIVSKVDENYQFWLRRHIGGKTVEKS
jgi:hypothetical protein